jgi:hypothetical protein
MSTVYPDISIPHQTIANWQRIVDLIATLADVPASLVMQTQPPDHSVLISNTGESHPYTVGQRYTLNEKLYCYGVLENGDLTVEDATCDPAWRDNEDMDHGMSFYIGFPLCWPDGSVFGTICVLDTRRNKRALLFRDGLQEFARVIETDLALLAEISRRSQLEHELQTTLDALEHRVVERTNELEIANGALRVLLSKVEESRDDYDAKILHQINGLVLPHLQKLKFKTQSDETASRYIALIEDNLSSMTASMSGQFEVAFGALTPTEREVAQMIMQGQTSKEIARTLARETSTVEYHRNNIRKKLDLSKSGKNLRSALLSLK